MKLKRINFQNERTDDDAFFRHIDNEPYTDQHKKEEKANSGAIQA